MFALLAVDNICYFSVRFYFEILLIQFYVCMAPVRINMNSFFTLPIIRLHTAILQYHEIPILTTKQQNRNNSFAL